MPPTSKRYESYRHYHHSNLPGEFIDLIVEFFDVYEAKIVLFVSVETMLDSSRARIFDGSMEPSRVLLLPWICRPFRPNICRCVVTGM